MFFIRKILIAAAILVGVVVVVTFGVPAQAAATRTQVEAVIRVYNSEGITTASEITLISSPKDLTQAGFLYRDAIVTPADQGDFYLALRGKTPYLIANAKGQDGLYRLKKVSSPAPLRRNVENNKNGVTYVRNGLVVGKDAIFAVHAQSGGYYKIRVLSLKVVKVPDLTPAAVLTSPINDADIASTASNVRVAWTGVAGAEKYTLALHCTSCEDGWLNRFYIFNSATRSYSLPLTDLPKGKNYYYLTVQGSAGTQLSPMSYPIYFTYTNTAVSEVATPVITAPMREQTFSVVPRIVTVTWNSVPTVSRYELAVDCDSCVGMSGWKRYQTFSSLSSSMTNQSISLPQDGTYTVYIRAYNKQGNVSDWSEKITFRFGAGTTPSPTSPTSNILPPIITSPTAGQVLGYFPRVVHVSWWKVPAASAYEISIECQSCEIGTTAWKELNHYTVNNVAGNASTFDIPALAIDSEYRLRMRSLDGLGQKGAWSEYTYFRFSTINLGVPVISSPSMNQTLTNSPRTFGVIWNAVNGAVNYVIEVSCKNCTSTAWGKVDYHATIDANPWFTTTIQSDDMYRVRVQAVDQYNNHTAWSEYVTFSFVTTPGNQIAAPRITDPAAGSEVSNATKQVSLAWTSVGTQYRYEVVVECNSCGTTTGWHYWKAYRTADSSNSLLITVPQNALYRFQVRAVDVDANRAGQWSDLTMFSYRGL